MHRQLQTNSHFRPINWAKFRKTEQLDSFIMELILMKICFQIIIEERILMYGSQKESGCRLSQRTWRARTTLGMACRIWSSSIRGPTTETQISTTYLHYIYNSIMDIYNIQLSATKVLISATEINIYNILIFITEIQISKTY